MNPREVIRNLALLVVGTFLICASAPIEAMGMYRSSLAILIPVNYFATYISALILTAIWLRIFRGIGPIPPYIPIKSVIKEWLLRAIFVLTTFALVSALTVCTYSVPALKEVFVCLLLGFGISFAAAGMINSLLLVNHNRSQYSRLCGR